MLVSCLAHASTPKMDDIPLSCQLTMNGLHGLLSQNTVLSTHTYCPHIITEANEVTKHLTFNCKDGHNAKLICPHISTFTFSYTTGLEPISYSKAVFYITL